jgi:ribosomal protein S18 acetylase RimI-like enzyme
MEIRQAGREDVAAVRACAEAAYDVYVERIGRKPAPMVADFAGQIDDGLIWVACDAGGVCGFVAFYARGDEMFLENVAVAPGHQGKGVGGRLIAFVEARARANELTSVVLYTNVRMSENLALYPRLGFDETGRVHEDGFDRVYFRKELAVS